MHISCLILQIISVLCVIIPNTLSTTDSISEQHPEIDINVAEICSPPHVCVHHNRCALEDYGAGVLIPKIFVRYEDNIKSDQSPSLSDGRIICNHLETCCEPSLTRELPEPDDVGVYKGCGLRNPNGVHFKVQTNDLTVSQFGEFPWTVALLRNNPSFREHELICGGSLIHPSVVLTAAHCVHPFRNKLYTFKVRAGEWDTLSEVENIPHQDGDVADMIIHEHFFKTTLAYDIALLILAEPFVLRNSVQTICLPSADLSSDNERKCYATGWGATHFSNSAFRTAIMKKIELPVVSRSKCQRQLRRTRLGYSFTLHQSFMCAGGVGGQDTCIGDGGSPLVCPYRDDNNRYYQTGIVAGGVDCGQPDVPGVYVDVAKYRTWIDRKMALHRFYLQSIV